MMGLLFLSKGMYFSINWIEDWTEKFRLTIFCDIEKIAINVQIIIIALIKSISMFIFGLKKAQLRLLPLNPKPTGLINYYYYKL